ncbi:MAG: hypothetical protein PWP48_769 [Clostridiales bacterium]|nr:hypothetical protein [Clostridiales bacterium]
MKIKFLCLLLSAVFLFTFVSCSQNNSNVSTSGDANDLVEEDIFGNVVIKTDNGFKFQNIEWMSNQAVIKEKAPEASYEEKLDRWETHKKYDDREIIVLYHMQDDKFCGGEFLIKFDNESDYEAYLPKIKEQAEDFFKEPPMSNSLDDLVDGKEVVWEGKDKSYVRIIPSGEGDYYKNVITISVGAPIDIAPRDID